MIIKQNVKFINTIMFLVSRILWSHSSATTQSLSNIICPVEKNAQKIVQDGKRRKLICSTHKCVGAHSEHQVLSKLF